MKESEDQKRTNQQLFEKIKKIGNRTINHTNYREKSLNITFRKIEAFNINDKN